MRVVIVPTICIRNLYQSTGYLILFSYKAIYAENNRALLSLNVRSLGGIEDLACNEVSL